MSSLQELKEQEAKLMQEVFSLNSKTEASTLLNEALAAWKAKLKAKANLETGKYRLVFFATDPIKSRWDRKPRPYDPKIFSDEPWTVQSWCVQGTYDGTCMTSGLALADDPTDLLPPAASFLLLSMFELPYMICPTTVETLPLREKDTTLSRHLKPYCFGFRSGLPFWSRVVEYHWSNGELEHDLTDIEYLKREFFRKEKYYSYEDTGIQPQVKEQKRKLKKAKAELEFYEKSIVFHNSLLSSDVNF